MRSRPTVCIPCGWKRNREAPLLGKVSREAADMAASFASTLSRSRRQTTLTSNSAERDHFKAAHPERTRCSGRKVDAASLDERAAVIDPNRDASAA